MDEDSGDKRPSSQPTQVATDVWALTSPIPSEQLPYTLTYALTAPDGILLIDPGWHSAENLAALTTSLAAIGAGVDDIVTIVATHHHPDHLGAAAAVRELSGAELVLASTEVEVLNRQLADSARDPAHYALQLEGWGVPEAYRDDLIATFDAPSWLSAVSADRLMDGGDRLRHGAHDLLVVATPGHTGGHVCLADPLNGVIFTGDHVLPQIHPGIGIGILPGMEPLADYLESLLALAPFDDLLVLPGHEYSFRGLAGRREQLARHHLKRTREAAELLGRQGGASVWELAQQLTWTGGWGSLRDFMLHSALRQTEMHLELVRSGRAEVLLDRYS